MALEACQAFCHAEDVVYSLLGRISGSFEQRIDGLVID